MQARCNSRKFIALYIASVYLVKANSCVSNAHL